MACGHCLYMIVYCTINFKSIIMDNKKHKKKNLESYRTLFFQLGLLLTLGFVLFAFEWKSYDSHDDYLSNQMTEIIDEDVIIITKREEPKKPELQNTNLKLVDDSKTDTKDLKINVEDNQYTAVPKYVHIKKNVFEDPSLEDNTVHLIVEDMPLFPGGEEAMMKYLAKNIKYPRIAKETGIQGTVYIVFVVEKNGTVSNANVHRGIGGGCDDEALRVVNNMPVWKAGSQQGRPVRVQFNLPIHFHLK